MAGDGAGLAGPAKRCARKAVRALPTTVPTATVPTLCGLKATFTAGATGKGSSGETDGSAARLVLFALADLRAPGLGTTRNATVDVAFTRGQKGRRALGADA